MWKDKDFLSHTRRNESGAWYCRDVGLIYVKGGANPEDELVLLRYALLREFTTS